MNIELTRYSTEYNGVISKFGLSQSIIQNTVYIDVLFDNKFGLIQIISNPNRN